MRQTPALKTTTTSLIPRKKSEVPAAIKSLEAQLKVLRGNIDETVSLDVTYDRGIVIKDVETVGKLLEISASITARSAAYAVEAKRYKVDGKVQEFTQSGKTVEEWYKIIDKAVNELINKVKIQKLESAIKGLSEFLDEDTKLANKLTSIMEDVSERLV